MTRLRATATLPAPSTVAAPGDPVRLVAATEERADDGYILLMSGAQLSRFRRNPIILWQHDRSRPPVGQATRVFVDGSRLLVDVLFDTGSELGADLDRQYRNGSMRALSIGFTILSEVDPSNGIVARWELNEISAVTMPADSFAVSDLEPAGRQSLMLVQLANVRAMASSARHGYRRATRR